MFPARSVVRGDAGVSQAPRDDEPGASERRPGCFSHSLGASRALADAQASPSRSLLPRERVLRDHDRGQ